MAHYWPGIDFASMHATIEYRRVYTSKIKLTGVLKRWVSWEPPGSLH